MKRKWINLGPIDLIWIADTWVITAHKVCHTFIIASPSIRAENETGRKEGKMNRISEIQVLLHQDEMNQIQPRFTKADAIILVKELIDMIADLTAQLETSRQIQTAEKKILIEEIEKNAPLTAERDKAQEELEFHAWEISPAMAQAKIDELTAENERLKEQYNELIMEVERKYPSESRHQTARRYIREREAIADCNPKQDALKQGKEENDGG